MTTHLLAHYITKGRGRGASTYCGQTGGADLRNASTINERHVDCPDCKAVLDRLRSGPTPTKESNRP